MTSIHLLADSVAEARRMADECVTAFDVYGQHIHPEADTAAACGMAADALDAAFRAILDARNSILVERTFTRASGDEESDARLRLLGELADQLNAAELRLRGSHGALMARIRGVVAGRAA